MRQGDRRGPGSQPRCWLGVGSGPGNEGKPGGNNARTPTARFFPHSQRRRPQRPAHRFHRDTGAGRVDVQAGYGLDPRDRHWGCPLRERWDLAAYQPLSPGWPQPLAFPLTGATAYEGAAALRRHPGHPADDPTLHTRAPTRGARAEEPTRERLKHPVAEPASQRAGSEVGGLMLEGWMGRRRGPGGGENDR